MAQKFAQRKICESFSGHFFLMSNVWRKLQPEHAASQITGTLGKIYVLRLANKATRAMRLQITEMHDYAKLEVVKDHFT